MTDAELKNIIEFFNIALERPEGLEGPFEIGRIKSNMEWENPNAISNLPETQGIYFICSKTTTNPDMAFEIRSNVILNNRRFQREYCIHLKWENSLFNKTPSIWSLRLRESIPDSILIGEDFLDKIKIFEKKTTNSRIIKIGKAARSGGIQGRIKSYKRMEAAITRYIFGTPAFSEIEIYCLKTENGPEAKRVEKKAIHIFETIYGAPPPWEQK